MCEQQCIAEQLNTVPVLILILSPSQCGNSWHDQPVCLSLWDSAMHSSEELRMEALNTQTSWRGLVPEVQVQVSPQGSPFPCLPITDSTDKEAKELRERLASLIDGGGCLEKAAGSARSVKNRKVPGRAKRHWRHSNVPRSAS